jgi:hypothetical protein
MTADERKEMLRLVELDYQRTSDLIERLTGIGTALRGAAITAWVAILAFAVAGKPIYGLLASAVAAAIWLTDGYNAFVYDSAADHARIVERISALYYGALARSADDPDAFDDVDVALAGLRFGLYTNLGRHHLRDIWFANPRTVFRVLYPVLIVGGALVALAVAIVQPSTPSPSGPSPMPSHSATSNVST